MWRIIDIGGDELFLHVDHDNLVAIKNKEELSRVHFSDIHSIVCHSYGATYSDKLFKKCLEYNVPLVICDDKHCPQGMLMPFMQHTSSGKRFQIQLETPLPRKKNAWKLVIEEKLANQSLLLDKIDHPSSKLKLLSKHVLSGDSDNKEAQGARIYFPNIFGEGFLRRTDSDVNILLNYAYTILRSCMARAVLGAGLHPSIGIHHSANFNPYCLVDDLMEPFRPLADYMVIQIMMNYENIQLCPKIKKELISLSKVSVYYNKEELELSTALQYFAQKFFHYLEGGELDFPKFNYDFSI